MLRDGGFEHEKENGLRERDPRCLGRMPGFAALLGCVKFPALREKRRMRTVREQADGEQTSMPREARSEVITSAASYD